MATERLSIKAGNWKGFPAKIFTEHTILLDSTMARKCIHLLLRTIEQKVLMKKSLFSAPARK